MRKIRIAFPKGKVHGNSKKIIEESFNVSLNKNQLSFSTSDYEVFLLKHRDIARLIDNKTLDFGVTSEEWIREYKVCANILKKLDWCTTKMALIASNQSVDIQTCVTEFPNIARDYFNSDDNVTILPVSGSSESLVPMLFDCCIDCVETGETLRENSLNVLKELFTSSMVLISNIEINEETVNKVYQDIHF